MPVPTHDTDHAAELVALLTSRYRGLPVTAGAAKALGQAVQELEDAAFAVIDAVQLANHPMGGGPWDVLDRIGALVGVARTGRADVDYLAAIKIQIRINRSHGLAEDIIQITALVVSGAQYFEWPPGAFEVDVFASTDSVVKALVQYLGKARSAGTSGTVRYSTTTTWPTGQLIRWGSVSGGVPNAKGFKDIVSGQSPNELAGLQKI